MAAKAGQVVSGFSKVEGARKGSRPEVLIHASDGAARTESANWTPSRGKTPESSSRNRAVSADRHRLIYVKHNWIWH